MFLIITFLSYFKYDNLTSFRSLKSSNEFDCMLGYMDKLINDGITKKEYDKCIDPANGFTEMYEGIVNTVLDENMKLPEPFLDNVTQYFNLKRSLVSLLPDDFTFFEENKDMFKTIRPVIADLGPDLCQVLSLNFNTVINLYDYILINKENDGRELGKIIKMLGVSSDIIPKVGKILSFFDPSNETISVLMDGLNVKNEYKKFLNIIKNLKIPEDERTKFFSFLKVVDSFSAGIDIFEGVLHNFIEKYINEFFVPLIKTYLIKPINIFDKSIYERANGLVNVLIKIQDYSLSCSIDPDKMTESDQNKCMLFRKIIDLISNAIPSLLSEDGNDDENMPEIDLDLLKERTAVFTNQEINLTSILIDNYTISENYVKFFFGTLSNMTDTNKNYVDLFEGTHLISNETENAPELKKRDFDFDYDGEDGGLIDNDINEVQEAIMKFIANLTEIIKFIDNLDDTSNFKFLFDYLGLSEYWEKFSFIMEQIERDNTICDNFLMDIIFENDTGACMEIVDSIKAISELFTTTKELIKLLNEPQKLILDLLTPVFKELNLRISLLVNLIHKAFLAPLLRAFADIDMPKKVDYSNIIKSSGGLLTKTFTFLDELTPTLIKKIPFIGDLITKVSSKIIEFLSLLRDNVDLATFFNFFLGGSSVVTKMLTNLANAYDKNPSISGADFAKSIQPTSFLNVYETANQINKVDELRYKNLANAITYDGSTNNAQLLNGSSAKLLDNQALTFNDFLPFKSIVQNSKDLSKGLKDNKLNINIVAKSIGTGEDNVKQSLNSVIKTALSPPADAIFASSVSSGMDADWVRAYLNGICEFSTKVAKGELVKTKTNEYIKVKKSKKLSAGAIAGIVIAAVVVVGVAVFLGVYFGVIRKRNQNADIKEDANASDATGNRDTSHSTLL